MRPVPSARHRRSQSTTRGQRRRRRPIIQRPYRRGSPGREGSRGLPITVRRPAVPPILQAVVAPVSRGLSEPPRVQMRVVSGLCGDSILLDGEFPASRPNRYVRVRFGAFRIRPSQPTAPLLQCEKTRSLRLGRREPACERAKAVSRRPRSGRTTVRGRPH